MTVQDMLDDRYGRRSRRSRVWTWSIIGTVAVLAVATLITMTVLNSLKSVDASASGYHVVDARSVTLDFQLTAPAGSAVSCVLEADDEEHGIVGWKVISLPASDTHRQSHTMTIPTVALATTGLVNTCWVP